MENIEKIMVLLTKYLEQQTANISTGEIIVSIVIPIIGAVILITSAVASAVKYNESKNKEIYEKILSEVYSPLYQYFVKQELLRSIFMPETNYKDSPILEFKTVNEKIKSGGGKVERSEHEKVLLNMSRDGFIEIKNTINIGLATQELLTLLNMYEVLIYIEKENNRNDQYFLSRLIQEDVETSLRKEIFAGYRNCYNKLGLKQNTKAENWVLSDDQIDFKVLKSDKQILKSREKYK